MVQKTHRAGFVHLIGKPNAGKSTLFNTLVKAPLSIVTHKPQTTRKNIVGITHTPDRQVIYVDTPGYLQPKYLLQKAMVKSIRHSIPGADILLWVVDAREKEVDAAIWGSFIQEIPTFLLLNKIDLLAPDTLATTIARWQQLATRTPIIPISARYGTHMARITAIIEKNLPQHPPLL